MHYSEFLEDTVPFYIGEEVVTDFYSYGSNKQKEKRTVTSVEWKGKHYCATGWWVCAKNKKGLPLCCDAAWFEAADFA